MLLCCSSQSETTRSCSPQKKKCCLKPNADIDRGGGGCHGSDPTSAQRLTANTTHHTLSTSISKVTVDHTLPPTADGGSVKSSSTPPSALHEAAFYLLFFFFSSPYKDDGTRSHPDCHLLKFCWWHGSLSVRTRIVPDPITRSQAGGPTAGASEIKRCLRRNLRGATATWNVCTMGILTQWKGKLCLHQEEHESPPARRAPRAILRKPANQADSQPTGA